MYYNEQAIILSRQTWGEDDLLLKVYSEHRGKLILKARGAKKFLSKLAGHLEPASLSYFNLVQGKNMIQIIGVEHLKSYAKIKSDLKKIEYVGSILNIFDKLILDSHQDKRIFMLLEKYLDFFELACYFDHYQYELAQMAVGYKLLYFLGLNPALKTNFRSEIDFIIKNNLRAILQHQKIKHNFNSLKKIVVQEIKNNLP